MQLQRILKSLKDASSSFVFLSHRPGRIEARYVRPSSEKASLFLSTHHGCTMGCRMCPLTHMPPEHQNLSSATLEELLEQADVLFRHTAQESLALPNKVNVNFMARGDPLASYSVLFQFPQLHQGIQALKQKYLPHAQLKIGISSIFPYTIRDRQLDQVFHDLPDVHMYYSIYSVEDRFQKAFMPAAVPYHLALDKLKRFQERNHRPVTLNFAFIKGRNDRDTDVYKMADIIREYDFNPIRVNLIPFERVAHLNASSQAVQDRLFRIFCDRINATADSRIVPIAGADVSAACGTYSL